MQYLLGISVIIAALMLSTPSAQARGHTNTVGGVDKASIYDNPRLNDYVTKVGERIVNASGLGGKHHFEFYVINDQASNAMATADGFIFVTLGLLALLTSEDQLAAILGHEVAHVTRHHHKKHRSSAEGGRVLANIGAIGSYYATGSSAIAQVAGSLGDEIGAAWVSGFGRKMELDADSHGAQYLVKAGYKHGAMMELLTLTKQEQLLQKRFMRARKQTITYHAVQSTHPAADKRLQEVLAMASSTPVIFNEVGPVDDYLAVIDGLPFGGISDEGVDQDNRYLNRRLGIEAKFPLGWEIKVLGGDLMSSPRGAPDKAYYLVKMVPPVTALDPEDLENTFRTLLGDREMTGIKHVTGGRMLGLSTTLTPNTPHHKAQRAALLYDDSRAYLILAALGENGDARPWHDGFQELIESIGVPGEDTNFQAGKLRISVVSVERGDSYESLAKKIPSTTEALRAYLTDYMRLINGDYPRGQIGEGERVKVIF